MTPGLKEQLLHEATIPGRTIARAFLLSLSVHAALGAILWYLISNSLQAPPHEQRLEVELTPSAITENAAIAVAQASVESVPSGPANKRDGARTNPIVHAPARTTQTTPDFVAPAATNTILPSHPDVASPALADDSARLAQAPDTSAIDLRVLDWLARYRTYPLAARRAHLEGVVQLRVTLMPDGRFVDARVERSSGHVLLDQAALDLLARASPLPAEFASERNGQIELQLPIVFRMRASPS